MINTTYDTVKQICHFEGLRTEAYVCAGGRLTIGYGHTQGVEAGDRVTEEEALELLYADLRKAEQTVEKAVGTLRQNQADALVSFVFNVGATRFLCSRLLRLLKHNKDSADIPKEIRRWVYAGGKKLKGLETRRDWEARKYADH